jgi:hypothetical protein
LADNAVDLFAAPQHHKTGDALDAVTLSDLSLSVDVDMVHVESSLLQTCDDRLHFPTGLAPGGGKMEQLTVA